eukprot:GHVL01021158.1.p3 GENE.GHVL01021158.1~~GHVL01021158.1.p3  ORF type:complete len:326 (-),score=54.50 GHVL01021158.1:3899-4876(-)
MIGFGTGIGLLWLMHSLSGVLYEMFFKSSAAPYTTILSRAEDSQIPVTKILIIANPHAGLKKFDEIFDEIIKPLLIERDVEFTVIRSEHEGHALEIAATQAEVTDYSTIVVGGGDGTIHEVLNGLRLRTDRGVDCVLGFLPMGSSNSLFCDFLFQDGVPESLGGALKEKKLWGCGIDYMKKLCDWTMKGILSGRVARVDLLKFQSGSLSLFGITTGAFGLMADVNILGEDFRWLGVSFRYQAAAIWAILKFIKKTAKIRYRSTVNAPKQSDNLKSKGSDPLLQTVVRPQEKKMDGWESIEEDLVAFTVDKSQHWTVIKSHIMIHE